jgi:hypothetical protein
MPPDPLRTFETRPSSDNFAVRREVVPVKTERVTSPPPNRHLKKLGFQGAHIWPLNWGGPELKRVFYAHGPTVNLSIQKRVENAIGRLTRMANRHGIRIFVTADAWRYRERDLLERITYRIEAVTPDLVAHDLGEITVHQNLSQQQRTDLVEGRDITIRRERIVSFEGRARTSRQQLVAVIDWLRRTTVRGPRRGRHLAQPDGGAGGGATSGPDLSATALEQKATSGSPGDQAAKRSTAEVQRGTSPESGTAGVARGTTGSQRGLGSTPGTKQAVRGVFWSIGQGYLAQAALSKDVAARRAQAGYASLSQDYDANESRIVKAYRALSGAKGEAGLDERFDIRVYRDYLRHRAALAQPGEELTVGMPIRRGRGDPLVDAAFRDVRVVYRKYPPAPRNGQWLDIRVENWPEDAAIPYIPDLDRIIDPARSDEEILRYMGIDG